MSNLFELILIATDGSKYSEAAIRDGIELARVHHAMIHAVNVIDTRELVISNGVPENLYQMMEKEGCDIVERVKNAAGDLSVGTFVLSGDPATAISEFARDNSVDLIILGSLGRSGIEEIFLGSVADKVIRTAPCPVLVVKNTRIARRSNQ